MSKMFRMSKVHGYDKNCSSNTMFMQEIRTYSIWWIQALYRRNKYTTNDTRAAWYLINRSNEYFLSITTWICKLETLHISLYLKNSTEHKLLTIHFSFNRKKNSEILVQCRRLTATKWINKTREKYSTQTRTIIFF